MTLIAALFVSFFALCLLGVPVAVSLGMSALITGWICGIIPLVMVQQMYSMVNSYTLLAIPLFLLVGNIMEHGQITERLVGFASTLVGHIRGGLGQVNVLSNLIMAGISGSANADAAALGSMMIPAMEKEGYPPDMAAAINACASTMGPIIPPSMLMVVYGAYGGVSVASMFLAGFIPGVFIALFMMITIYHWAKKYPSIKLRERRASLKEIWQAFRRAILALLVPVIIIVGVLGGKFTATESGMIAAVYSLLVTAFVYRSITLGDFVQIVKKTLLSMAGVPSTAVIKRTVPFYLSFLAVAVIMIFFPDVILLLPRMLLGA